MAVYSGGSPRLRLVSLSNFDDDKPAELGKDWASLLVFGSLFLFVLGLIGVVLYSLF